MEQVSIKFYSWYNNLVTAFGGILFVATAVVWLVPGLENYRINLGLSLLTGVFGLTQLLYGTLLFRSRVRSNPYMAAVLSSIFTTLNILNQIQITGQFHSWFLIAWIIMAFSSGLFGIYGPVVSGLLITIYYVIAGTNPASTTSVHIDPIAIAGIIGSYIACFVSYRVWKRFYIDQESRQLNQLAGQLKSKQLQTEILIESIGDGIIVTDTEGKISLLNPAASAITRWPVDEAVGIDVSLVAKLRQEDGSEIDSNNYPFRQVLKSGKQIKMVVQTMSRDEQDHRIVSLIISPVVLPKSNELVGSIAVLRDVSAEREEEHRRADFISTASHEMRTPVAAIEGYLALALNAKVSSIDNKARSFLLKAHESTQRLGQLFQDLLTSAKAEDGRLVNHPIVVEMGEYLTQISDGLRFSAEKKQLLMDFTVGTHDQQATNPAGGKTIRPLYYALIDPDRMQEVITNVFDNAVKYTETGKISVGLTGNDDVIQIFIRDTGHGIPAEDLPHLFQKFYRVDNSSTRTIGGTGLGLFICRKIVEMYNGRIWVESEINKGSTFYINLPRISSQKASELQVKQSTQLKL